MPPRFSRLLLLCALAWPLASKSQTQSYSFTLLAGQPYPAFAGNADGTAIAARFKSPLALAADSTGNVYVDDWLNREIRRVTPAGVVTTYAGGAGSAAQFQVPQGVAVDSTGNVYVSDTVNNTVTKITPPGQVTTFASSATLAAVSGGGGPAAFYYPTGVAVDSHGNVYVAGTGNSTIVKITPDRTASLTGTPFRTEIDTELAATLPISQLPCVADLNPASDLSTALATYINIFSCLNEQHLRLQALGLSRLVKRLTMGRFDLTPKVAGLPHVPDTFDLGGGSKAVFVGDAFREIHLRAFGSAYQPGVHERIGLSELRQDINPAIDDCSFFITSKDVDLFVKGHVIQNEFAKCFHTTGLTVQFLSQNDTRTNSALACALILLQHLYGLKGIRIFETDRNHLYLWKALEKKRCLFLSSVYFQPVVDLTPEREEIFRGIRKSNKVDVNWGLKNLTFQYHTGQAIPPETSATAYDFLLSCHRQRDKIQRYGDHMPKPKYDTIIRIVEEGSGILSIARDARGAIVGVVILVWESGSAYYQEAGFINDVDNRSPAYSVIFDLMLKVKSLGLKRLAVNRLLQSTLECFDKKVSRWDDWRWGNSHFKQAFSPDVNVEFMYNFESSTRPVTLTDGAGGVVFGC